MKIENQLDILRTRQSIETVATKFNIYFTLAMAMCGSILFIVGLVMTRVEFLNDLPEAGIMVALGMFGFSLFFPWFTALYFSRHLLCAVKKVEGELVELKNKENETEQEATSNPYQPPCLDDTP